MNIFELTRILNEAKKRNKNNDEEGTSKGVKIPEELKVTKDELNKTTKNFVLNAAKEGSHDNNPDVIEKAEIALRRAESFIEDKNAELMTGGNEKVRNLFMSSYEKLKKIGLYRQWMDKVIENSVSTDFNGITEGEKISFKEINPLFTENFIPLLYSFRGGNDISRGSGEFLMRLVFACLGNESQVAKKIDNGDVKTGDITVGNTTYEIKANNGRLDSMRKSSPEQLVEKILRLVKIFINKNRFQTRNNKLVNRTTMTNEQFSKYVLRAWFQTIKENSIGQSNNQIKLILVNKKHFMIISEDSIDECVKHLKISIPQWMVDRVLKEQQIENGDVINVKDISLDRTIKISLR